MKNKSLFFIMMVIIAFPYFLFAQREGCSGYVRSDNGSLLSNVNITFMNTSGRQKINVLSDERGFYCTALLPGSYYVTVVHKDYEDYSSHPGCIKVKEGAALKHNIRLYVPLVTTILLVRHAERINDDLTIEGQERAEKLVHVLAKANITAIYVTDCIRSKKTAAPLANYLGIKPTEYAGDSEVPDDFYKRIYLNNTGDVVLVVAHSDTIPVILDLPGLSPPALVNDYDNLYMITTDEVSAAYSCNVINFQYGANSNDMYGESILNLYPRRTIFMVRNMNQQSGLDSLVHMLEKTEITETYSDTTTLSEATVQPLVTELALDPAKVKSYDPDDLDTLLDQIDESYSHRILIAGNRENLLSLFSLLHAYPPKSIGTNEYDNLFVLNPYIANPKYTYKRMINLQFGNNSENLVPGFIIPDGMLLSNYR
ncbi:MAG: carboxypeptidase regulatory-like domain-containing protein [Spirochaetales bacterium]|nr:carboxypeptidase regulatory-like domain-containing protein [Spirochaetales bacterium]